MEQAERIVYNRINLRGTWESNRPVDPPTSTQPNISGNADALTGDFELFLWKVSSQEGLLLGAITPARSRRCCAWTHTRWRIGVESPGAGEAMRLASVSAAARATRRSVRGGKVESL